LEDPYKALGVAKDATAAQIRSAYRKLAKQHHPDLNPGDAEAEQRFKTVSAANDLLSDPDRRGRFDRGEIDASGQPQAPRSSYREHAEGPAGGRYGPGATYAGGWDEDAFADLFGSAFNGGARGGRDTPRRGGDERYTLRTDFLSAVNGATQRLTLPGGRALDAIIPAGTMDGQVLRLRGQGEAGANGGPSGDALIEIHVAPHAFFERDGRDIRMALPVTLAEAVLGGAVATPTPGGFVQLRIPPHSENGFELRLRGRGVPAHGGHPAGDLYARLKVMVGPPDPELDAFLKAWRPAQPFAPRQAMEALS